MGRRMKYIRADMRKTKPTHHNAENEKEAEKETKEKNKEDAHDTTVWEIIPWGPTEKMENQKQKQAPHHHIQGRPRQPEE